MIIALDTQTMIWGVLGRGNPEDHEMRRRAALLKDQLDADEDEPGLMISAITAAELLTHMNDPMRREFLAELSKDFEIAPFDVRASELAASLYDKHESLRNPGVPLDKVRFRTDTLIIASVKTAGATVFYSHDNRALVVASSIMQARDLPEFSENLPFRE